MGGLRSENRRNDDCWKKRSLKNRAARPLLTVARARERIAMYISGYNNITYRAQKERQGRPEQTPRVTVINSIDSL